LAVASGHTPDKSGAKPAATFMRGWTGTGRSRPHRGADGLPACCIDFDELGVRL